MPPVESGAVSHLSFKYKFESTSNGTLTYGTISGTNASTYTVLGTISNPSSNPGTIDVDLNTSQTTGKRIAFRWYKSGTWYTCGIDDVCIETTTIIPYEISTVADWNAFCAAVNSGHDYSGETVTLMNDITTAVTAMAGVTTGESTYNYAFKGTFDGQGHTLTVNLTSGTLSGSWYYTAPFRVIDGATIKNLKTTGTVTQNSGKGAAGLAGYTAGTCTITNCVSNVTINSLTNGDGTHGGFFSEIRGTTTMNNCAFTGSITGSNTNYCGGFVGWKSGTATFNNCVFAPSAITFDYTTGNSANFSRNGGTFNNCYYTQTCGTGWTQGKLMHSITGASGITVANAGTATNYTPETSTIVGYGTGIKFNNILYAGSGDNVSLTLSGGNNYTVDHGTLTGSGSSYTLQMADYDTYIFTPITVSVSANPSNGGTVSGGGQYGNGASATVSALPTGTYCFVNWTENGTVVSTDLNYTFTVTGARTLVANFSTFDASDITVSGNTNIACGTTTTLTASGLNGVAYNWYSDAACTQLVQENSATLTTPALIENTTYYVKAVGGTSYMEQETTFSYTGSAQTYSIPSGTTAVKLEVWGAEGGGQRTSGNTNSGYGGKGGYSVGTMPVSGGETLNVYVGGIGGYSSDGQASGGWNGGGTTYASSNTEPAAGGGGASDIRINGTTLYNRIIVAGGGGGGGEDSSDQGGYGGGTSGGAGNSYSYQGTQTSAGNGGVFGIGASSTYDGGAGGGGWYGGGCNGGSQTIPTSNSSSDCGGGSGGSGYVWTSSTSSSAPSGYNVPASYYLTDAQTIAGNASMPNPNGGTMTGREGDGYARITAYVTEECESVAVAVTVTVTQPAAPTNVTATADLTTATVSWDDNGESSWEYSIDGGANWTNASTNTVNLSGLTPGQTYTFQVKAVNGDCESEAVSESFTTINNVTFTLDITGHQGGNGNWYLITSPLNTAIVPTAVTNMVAATAGDYDLFYFDQTASDGLEWRNYKQASFSLVPGTGYLYANKYDVTLTFSGVPYQGDGTVPLTYSEDNESEYMWGLNLVGNPYHDAQAEVDCETYYTMNDGSELIVGTTYIVDPMEAIIVRATESQESMCFSRRISTGNSTGKKRAGLALNVTQGRSLVDRAVVRFDGTVTLPKFQLNPSHTKVYIPQDDKDYAVVYAESNVGEMPVNFKAEKNGTYTIGVNAEEVSFGYLHLIDNKTGADVDLLAMPSYTFDALTTDYASRFKLVFATGSSANSGTFAFYSNGSFVISNDGEAVLQVMDVTGRIVKSETLHGCASVSVNAAPGVYMLRLVNGESEKVQKVVVR